MIITLIPGDGIGPEVTRAVVKVLAAAGFSPEWETFSAGAEAVAEHGTTLPPALLESITRNKIALKGPISTPVGKGFTSVNVGLRKALDLYANLRPVWNLPSVPSRFQGVDLVIVRENTDKKGTVTLSPDDKARLAKNFKGYDISPDMVRLSLVAEMPAGVRRGYYRR